MFEAFKATLQVHDEIVECRMAAGGFDYLIKLRVDDLARYREIAARVLWQLPGVGESRTYAVMEEVKESTRLVLRRVVIKKIHLFDIL